MVKLEPDKALRSYSFRSGLRAGDIKACPVGRNAFNVFNADAEAESIDSADLFALLVKFHPENLVLSPVINEENSGCPGHVCNPRGVKLTADERRHAFWNFLVR